VDDCGVCFGGNAEKGLNPCHICDASACVVDCLGVANGTAVIDCAGICNGNSTCATPKPSGLAGDSSGTIAGAVVGACAGLIVLGLAAFLAVKYAQKNGLLGNAHKNLDFSGANVNPLYESEVVVMENPLFVEI